MKFHIVSLPPYHYGLFHTAKEKMMISHEASWIEKEHEIWHKIP